MTAMTTTALPAGEWTEIYTASGNGTIYVQNLTSASSLRVRADASADASSDALTAAHGIVNPYEVRQLTLEAGDVVIAAPVGDVTGYVNVHA